MRQVGTFIYPTHVGMNRVGTGRIMRTINLPHTCGDEPAFAPTFSVDVIIYPTHVGMNRQT